MRDTRAEAADCETYEMAADNILGARGNIEWSGKNDEGTGTECSDDDSLLQTQKQQDKECGKARDGALAHISLPVSAKLLPPGGYTIEADAVLPRGRHRGEEGCRAAIALEYSMPRRRGSQPIE